MRELNEDNFFGVVLQDEGLSVVQMTAPWCGPCRMLAPRLEELESEGKFNYYKVNVDEAPGLARDFRIMSVPTLLVYKDGKKVHEMIGAKTKQAILDELKSFM